MIYKIRITNFESNARKQGFDMRKRCTGEGDFIGLGKFLSKIYNVLAMHYFYDTDTLLIEVEANTVPVTTPLRAFGEVVVDAD